MFTPWNSFSACLLGRSDSIGEDSRNLLKPDGTIPLGLCHFKKRFFKKLHQRSVSGVCFVAILVNGTCC